MSETVGPPPGAADAYERLIAAGELIPPREPEPARIPRLELGEPYAASRALEAARGGKR